jgi:RND family efflux transporter MFP subunit
MNRKHDDRAACAVFCVLVSLLGGCGKPTEEEVETETVVSVKTEAASLGDIRGAVHATGVVNPAPGADLVVVAPEAARILEIPKATGDSVRQGDLLVRFEIPMSAAEVQRQQAEVTRAEATLGNAKAAQTRAADLFQRGVAARKEVEDADRAVADAEAGVVQARASLAAAETVAARAIVRATFDGVVAKRQHNPGDLVEAAASDPVLRVIDPRRLEVVASVPLAHAGRIEVGARVRLVEAPEGAREISLKVLSRPAAVEAGTATIPVRLGFSAPPNLPAGTPVQVEIDAEHHKGVVLIPTGAVVREGDETGVFIAAGGKAERRSVNLGLNDGAHVEIVSGVKAGEQVIVDGQAGLPDGAAISVADGAAAEPESGKGAAPEKDGSK